MLTPIFKPLINLMGTSSQAKGAEFTLFHTHVKNGTVNLGMFGQTAKFGQQPCLFYISNIGIKNKLTKQTVKILMRRLRRSRLIWIYTVCKCVSEFT